MLSQKTIEDFSANVGDILRILFKTNIDVNRNISSMIFCVFSSYYPELKECLHQEELKATSQDKVTKDQIGGKYKVRMMPLADCIESKDRKSTLFRTDFFVTSRIEQLNHFCMSNKKIINSLIKK